MTEPTGDIGDPTNRRGHMPVEAWGLVIAGRLAALAGMVDAIGYLHLSGLFVSFMSGNSTHLAVSLGQGNSRRPAQLASWSRSSCSEPRPARCSPGSPENGT